MRARRALALASAAAVAVAVPTLTATQSQADADDANQSVTVPSTAGQTVTVNFNGTIPPLSTHPTSQCDGTLEDLHNITVKLPTPDVYTKVSATFKFSIMWTPSSAGEETSDEILTVDGPSTGGGEPGGTGSSDTANTTEVVTASNLLPATYKVRACGFVNTAPQPYTGKLEVTTIGAAGEPSVKSAPANGLKFSASVAADPQRDEAEPLIETAPDGHTYTCGPTGFGSASDYAQVSTDGGDQFHLLGTPPRGQQAVGGGGDCAIALAPDRNRPVGGAYTYAYAGLGPLTGFTTSTSPDNGHTLFNAGPQGNGLQDTGALADRQWLTFIDKDSVLLSYNQQAPRNIVVQRSDNGGLTYSPVTAVGGADPDFPGPMRTLPAKFNIKDPTKTKRVVYFGWNVNNNVNLSVSYDGGLTFVDCVAATNPGQPRAGFVTVDNDNQGNIYIAYADKAKFHSYMTVLPINKLGGCNQEITPGGSNNPLLAKQPKNDPAALGFTTPVQVDRDAVRTTVFPWIAAGGAPGRVAVTFYGTETEGDPNRGDFKASWNVYVNQSVNALSGSRTFSQVKATTHPFHYNSICLNGLGCSLTQPNGDRSLADFFAIKTNPATGRLQVVYNNDAKLPTESFGHVASPMVFTQIGGPNIKGGTGFTVTRQPTRQSSTDFTGDALADYSNLFATGASINEPATDFTSASIAPLAGGGFTLNMQLASLSTANLAKALTETNSNSLLYTLRFSNAFQPFAVTARYNGTWTFKVNDYDTAGPDSLGEGLLGECFAAPSTSSDKCLAFGVAGTELQGSVDQATNTISIKVPLLRPNGTGNPLLFKLTGGTGDKQTPTRTKATPGSLFYDASAFSFGDPSASDIIGPQSYLYPLDNTPAMDFKLP
jgi:hypothetical protein